MADALIAAGQLEASVRNGCEERKPPFGDHKCCKCGAAAEVLHFCTPRQKHYCWNCWKEKEE